MPVTINPEVRKPIQGLPEDFKLAHVRGEIMTDPRLIERPGFKSAVGHGVAKNRQQDLHVQIFDKDNREGIDVRIPAFMDVIAGDFVSVICEVEDGRMTRPLLLVAHRTNECCRAFPDVSDDPRRLLTEVEYKHWLSHRIPATLPNRVFHVKHWVARTFADPRVPARARQKRLIAAGVIAASLLLQGPAYGVAQHAPILYVPLIAASVAEGVIFIAINVAAVALGLVWAVGTVRRFVRWAKEPPRFEGETELTMAEATGLSNLTLLRKYVFIDLTPQLQELGFALDAWCRQHPDKATDFVLDPMRPVSRRGKVK